MIFHIDASLPVSNQFIFNDFCLPWFMIYLIIAHEIPWNITMRSHETSRSKPMRNHHVPALGKKGLLLFSAPGNLQVVGRESQDCAGAARVMSCHVLPKMAEHVVMSSHGPWKMAIEILISWDFIVIQWNQCVVWCLALYCPPEAWNPWVFIGESSPCMALL